MMVETLVDTVRMWNIEEPGVLADLMPKCTKVPILKPYLPKTLKPIFKPIIINNFKNILQTVFTNCG
ncbi:hypothetical protein BpHYR1_009824 [Brachionus plicatilis]|uniref:Uncharacterized protein n=1 Tax=Brachionus plicatilis TaxID=10195 RepID=A0A3M7RX23_BRAPC|nr:hypothetical protein BpHYR1_009824 [Brachionus plicatilis]